MYRKCKEYVLIDPKLVDLETELDQKLGCVSAIFDIDTILAEKTNRDRGDRYLPGVSGAPVPLFSRAPKSLSHEEEARLHLSDRLVPSVAGEVPEVPLPVDSVLEKYISGTSVHRVLEIGVGSGEFSFYFATKHPQKHFSSCNLGVDTFKYAAEKIRGIKNLEMTQGLPTDTAESSAPKQFFDCAFSVDGLSLYPTLSHVVESVAQSLKTGDPYIVADQFLTQPSQSLTKSFLRARYLVGQQVTIHELESYEMFVDRCKQYGLKVSFGADLSESVLDRVDTRYRRLEAVFAHPGVTRLAVPLLPHDVRDEMISAYLLPTVLRLKMVQYQLTVFEKQADGK